MTILCCMLLLKAGGLEKSVMRLSTKDQLSVSAWTSSQVLLLWQGGEDRLSAAGKVEQFYLKQF